MTLLAIAGFVIVTFLPFAGAFAVIRFLIFLFPRGLSRHENSWGGVLIMAGLNLAVAGFLGTASLLLFELLGESSMFEALPSKLVLLGYHIVIEALVFISVWKRWVHRSTRRG